MDTWLLGTLIGLVVLLLCAILALVYVQLRRPQNATDLSPALQNLNQTLQTGQSQTAALAEKLSHMEQGQEKVSQSLQAVGSGVHETQVEIRSLAERVGKVEQNQGTVGQDIHKLDIALTQSSTVTHSLVEAAEAIRTDLTSTRNGLIDLQNATQVEVRSLVERVGKVEQNQGTVGQDIHKLDNVLAQASTVTRSLVETAEAIRTDLANARSGIVELQTQAKTRHAVEQQTADSVQRLEAIIAGTRSKGVAGENILESIFAQLPAAWQVRDFRVAGKVVEFGLRLPNSLILPIDSKWPATNLLEQFGSCEDSAEQQKLKAQIADAVVSKAKEVKKYIDPSQTVDFGIAVVPDAVYDLCHGIHAEVFGHHVLLVSYSMFLPYLLLVFQTVGKTSQSLDLKKLDGYLSTIQEHTKALQEQIEGRFSTAITMLNNSREIMRTHISKVSIGLANLESSTTAAEALVSLVELPLTVAQEKD
ncbi:MAG: DNA recombination protein RmuC [Chloroflexota bacterium]|nr:DNA recombination protein RmuC [Chloroflexota bacterium]